MDGGSGRRYGDGSSGLGRRRGIGGEGGRGGHGEGGDGDGGDWRLGRDQANKVCIIQYSLVQTGDAFFLSSCGISYVCMDTNAEVSQIAVHVAIPQNYQFLLHACKIIIGCAYIHTPCRLDWKTCWAEMVMQVKVYNIVLLISMEWMQL